MTRDRAAYMREYRQRRPNPEQRAKDIGAARAHDEALSRLRDAYRDTFDVLLTAARAKRGLPPVGTTPKGRPRRAQEEAP